MDSLKERNLLLDPKMGGYPFGHPVEQTFIAKSNTMERSWR